jgi:hypothetical protein
MKKLGLILASILVIFALVVPAFPVLASPYDQMDKLTASDGSSGDELGNAIAADGNTMVIAAQGAGGKTGAVYVYYKDQGGLNNWGQVKKITASDGVAGDYFGWAVSISGDTCVIGAEGATTNAPLTGAAYIFERNLGGTDNWGLRKKIVASDADFFDTFGFDVAINEDTLVVGSPRNNDQGGISGSAYVYERNLGGANNWGERKKLLASGGVAGDFFGDRVSINGDTIAIANTNQNTGWGNGYIFDRNEGGANNWGQVKKINGSDEIPSDNYGTDIAIYADTVVIGSFFAPIAGVDYGAAYIYERNLGGTNNWGEEKKIRPNDSSPHDRFGYAVDIKGDSILVGAYYWQNRPDSTGSAYVFNRNQGGSANWGQVAQLAGSDTTNGDWFGFAACLGGSFIGIGAPINDANGKTDSGAAYVFGSLNQAPVANNQTVITDEDTALAITLTATDIDSSSLTYSIASQPGHGTLSGTAHNVTYVPNLNYNGLDSFTFKANDGQVDSNVATVSITVKPVNDAPLANNQTVMTDEDTALTITLTASDVDEDALTYGVVTQPSHGSLSGAAPHLTYMPVLNYNGPDSFTFRTNDSSLNSNTATVYINVNPVNDPPVIQSVTVNPNQLWPPNKKPVDVKITVNANDADGASDILKTTYSVIDEYGIYNVAETNLPLNGKISLIADRDGNDKDGRIYTITIRVYDAGGLFDQKSVNVLVPHDQGK